MVVKSSNKAKLSSYITILQTLKSLFFSILFIAFVHIGCWRKSASPKNLEPDVNSTHDILVDWIYEARPDSILRCAVASIAEDKGYTVFGLHDGGECWTSEESFHFVRKGPLNSCVGGRGGENAVDVYILQSEFSF